MSLARDELRPPGPIAMSRPPLLQRLAASRRFQRWAARFPLTRWLVRREGAAMFDLVAGFCHSQVLRGLVGLDLLTALAQPAETSVLAHRAGVPGDRLEVLLRAAAALGLLRERRGRWSLTARGAALAAVPGLPGMIAHHDVLYRDLADPVAFFRGGTEPELARFWPYVFGAAAAADPAAAARYSRLMTDSQALVAEDTLALADLRGVRRLLDIGGGTGAFLQAVRAAHPGPDLVLFDLPAVLRGADLSGRRISAVPGSFRDDPLPGGADAVSLVRVLYDHDDDTVRALLGRIRDALPPGGRLIVSEPMGGSRAGDAYFALYCLAMETGRVRRPAEIGALMAESGFRVAAPKTRRPYVTTVVEGVRQT